MTGPVTSRSLVSGPSGIDQHVVAIFYRTLVARPGFHVLRIAAERATDGGRRISGIVNVAVCRLGFGCGCGERAVATDRICFAGRVQKIFCVARLRRRPIIFLAVFIRAHHEKLDGFIGGELILDAFKKKIVPVEDDVCVYVFHGVGSEVNIADAATETGMASDLDQQMLLGARCFRGPVSLGAHVIAQSAGIENVIPSTNLQHGNGNL